MFRTNLYHRLPDSGTHPVKRPLMSLSTADIERRFEGLDVATPEGQVALDAIEDELRHRERPTARRLLRRVQELRAGGGQGTVRSGTSSAAGTEKMASVPAGAAGYPPDKAVDTYLRLLIGEEAERLDRWGLTPSAPTDIIELVFAEWQRRLGEGPDLRGRSLGRLQDDRQWLAVRREGK
jgi:hypothetical protein